jgi:hypothetical protein
VDRLLVELGAIPAHDFADLDESLKQLPRPAPERTGAAERTPSRKELNLLRADQGEQQHKKNDDASKKRKRSPSRKLSPSPRKKSRSKPPSPNRKTNSTKNPVKEHVKEGKNLAPTKAPTTRVKSPQKPPQVVPKPTVTINKYHGVKIPKKGEKTRLGVTAATTAATSTSVPRTSLGAALSANREEGMNLHQEALPLLESPGTFIPECATRVPLVVFPAPSATALSATAAIEDSHASEQRISEQRRSEQDSTSPTDEVLGSRQRQCELEQALQRSIDAAEQQRLSHAAELQAVHEKYTSDLERVVAGLCADRRQLEAPNPRETVAALQSQLLVEQKQNKLLEAKYAELEAAHAKLRMAYGHLEEQCSREADESETLQLKDRLQAAEQQVVCLNRATARKSALGFAVSIVMQPPPVAGEASTGAECLAKPSLINALMNHISGIVLASGEEPYKTMIGQVVDAAADPGFTNATVEALLQKEDDGTDEDNEDDQSLKRKRAARVSRKRIAVPKSKAKPKDK